MSAFVALIWLNQTLSPAHVLQISHVLRTQGFTFDDPTPQKSRLSTLHPSDTYAIDAMIQQTRLSRVRDTLISYRERFLQESRTHYSWQATVHVDALPPFLRDDEWRRRVMEYDVSISTDWSIEPDLFRGQSTWGLDLIEKTVETIRWLPLSVIWIRSTHRHDSLLWGYLARWIMEITGGLLHPLFRSLDGPQTLNELHQLSEQGHFPGKAYALPYSYPSVDGKRTIDGKNFFLDVDFLTAWLDQPNFLLY